MSILYFAHSIYPNMSFKFIFDHVFKVNLRPVVELVRRKDEDVVSPSRQRNKPGTNLLFF